MKWQYQAKFLTSVAAAFLIATYCFPPEKGWACSVSGSTVFGHGSQTDSTSLVVCAKSTSIVKTQPKPVVTKPVQPKPVVYVKPIAPVKTVAKPRPIATPKAVVKAAPKVPPKQVSKPTPKPTVKSVAKLAAPTVKTKVSTAESRFSPNPARISASKTLVLPGEQITFEVALATHYRTAVMLGKTAEVRFVPKRVAWSFGDGVAVTPASAEIERHSFSHPGSYLVTVRVIYVASYRFAGDPDWNSGGEISVNDQIEIRVDNETSSASASVGIPLLVAGNCIERADRIGCDR